MKGRVTGLWNKLVQKDIQIKLVILVKRQFLYAFCKQAMLYSLLNGKNHRCDLLIEDSEGNFWRIQCKTVWLDEKRTVINFATASSYNHTAKQKGWRHYRGQADFFAVYCEELDKVYLIPVDTVGLTLAKLRLVATKNNQEKNVRWARDYELERCPR